MLKYQDHVIKILCLVLAVGAWSFLAWLNSGTIVVDPCCGGPDIESDTHKVISKLLFLSPVLGLGSGWILVSLRARFGPRFTKLERIRFSAVVYTTLFSVMFVGLLFGWHLSKAITPKFCGCSAPVKGPVIF